MEAQSSSGNYCRGLAPPGYLGLAAAGRYVRLSVGAGAGAAERRSDPYAGGLPVPCAVSPPGRRVHFRSESTGREAHDPGLLSH